MTKNFHCRCEEALTLYEQAFEATTQSRLRYANAKANAEK